MKQLRLIKAFRVNSDMVKVLYSHVDYAQEFLIEWFNYGFGYDLQKNVLSSNDNMIDKIESAIDIGEDDNNPDLELYLEIRDTFDSMDCEQI